MKQTIAAAAALALFAAGPSLGQNNAAEPANVTAANATATAAPDANAAMTAAPEATATPDTAAPADMAAPAPAPAPRSSFPWGVIGLVGLVGLLGARKRT